MPIAPPFIVSPFESGDNDIRPTMTRLPNGNIVVVYEHYSGADSSLAIRVLQPDGTPVTDEIFDTIGGYGVLPRVVAIDATHFAIVASDFGTASGAVELTAQVFTIDGTSLTQGGELPISNYASTNDDNGNDHQILRLPDGNFLVVWAQYTNGFGNAQLVARTFDADFNPLTPETRISEFDNTGVSNPHVSLDGATAVVSWNQNDPATGGSIHARVATFTVGADGSLPASPPNDVDVGDNTAVRSITHLANGDVLVLYVGGPTQGGVLDDNDMLSAKIYSADLSTVKATLQINPTIDDNGVSSVAVVAFASGGFQVIWGQDPAGGTNPSQDFELYARSYNHTYSPVGLPVLLTDNAVADTGPTALVDADGNVTLTWETANATGGRSIVGLYLEDQDPGFPNQEPAGTDHTATVAEDGTHTFSVAEFGFTDPDGGAFDAVVVTTLPARGVIVVVDGDGAVVQTLTAGQSVTAAQIAAGLVQYRPNADESGVANDSFTFQVEDDGGTEAGGVDRDQTPNTFTFDVTAVNDAPAADLNGVAAGRDTTADYVENATPVLLAPDAVLDDVDSANLSGATITITDGFQSLVDLLTVNGATSGVVNGVTFSYDPVAGVLSLSGAASVADYQAVVRSIGFESTSQAPGTTRTVSWVFSDGDAASTTVTTTIAVTAVDDPPVALDDTASTTESAPVSGDVLANDSDPDGPALGVSAVNGSTASVGVQITLASGALLTLNADGTYTYDPNGAFDALSGPASGGSNGTAADSFTYTLTDGSTATVTITVNGEDSEGDVVRGGSGDDDLVGGAGTDTADYSTAASGVRAQLNTGVVSDDGDGGVDTVSGIENLTGSDFNDLLVGEAGGNVLNGGAGADYLIGLDGDDTLIGGSGAANQLQGGRGDDTYVVSGNDTLVEFADEGVDTVRTDRDAYVLKTHFENLTYTGAGDFRGVGNAGDNTITGGAGDDVLIGGAGDDVLEGGSGVDAADYSAATGGVTASLFDGVAADGDGGSDVLGGIETLIGSTFGDDLEGDDGANALHGGDGDDVLAGRGGDDVMRGGDGLDTADYAAAAGRVLVKLGLQAASDDGDGGSDRLIGIENLTGSDHDDILIGDMGDNVVMGGLGADYLIGLAGNDTLVGGDGAANQLQGGLGDDLYIVTANDTLLEFADEGIDTVQTTRSTYALRENFENLAFTGDGDFSGTGNAEDNVITGGAGDDILAGGAGDDALNGGLGDDAALLSGSLSDYVIEDLGGGQYRITDSVGGRDGVDLLDGVERVRFGDGSTALLTDIASPAAPLSAEKAGDAQILPGLGEDEFVLGKVAGPLVLPDPAADDFGLLEAPTPPVLGGWGSMALQLDDGLSADPAAPWTVDHIPDHLL